MNAIVFPSPQSDDAKSISEESVDQPKKRMRDDSFKSSESKRTPRQAKEDNINNALSEMMKTSKLIQETRPVGVSSKESELDKALNHFQKNFAEKLEARQRLKFKTLLTNDDKMVKLYNSCDDEERELLVTDKLLIIGKVFSSSLINYAHEGNYKYKLLTKINQI